MVVCFRTQLLVHLRFSLFYKGMPVWFNKLHKLKKYSFVYPRVMGFDALKHYFITYEVYM